MLHKLLKAESVTAEENSTAKQDYIVESIKVAEIELMRGHTIVESQNGHKLIQIQIEILVELIDHQNQDFVGKQVDYMSNALIATKKGHLAANFPKPLCRNEDKARESVRVIESGEQESGNR